MVKKESRKVHQMRRMLKTGVSQRVIMAWKSVTSHRENDDLNDGDTDVMWILIFFFFKDFACLQWFLPFCFGESAPDSSLVKRCSSINEENVNEIILATDVPYSYIKRLAGVLNEESKTRIATYTESLSTVLW